VQRLVSQVISHERGCARGIWDGAVLIRGWLWWLLWIWFTFGTFAAVHTAGQGYKNMCEGLWDGGFPGSGSERGCGASWEKGCDSLWQSNGAHSGMGVDGSAEDSCVSVGVLAVCLSRMQSCAVGREGVGMRVDEGQWVPWGSSS